MRAEVWGRPGRQPAAGGPPATGRKGAGTVEGNAGFFRDVTAMRASRGPSGAQEPLTERDGRRGGEPGPRWFVALWPPPRWVEQLARLQERLRRGPWPFPARWVAPPLLHVTLAFLGEGDPSRRNDVLACLERAARSMPPFAVRAGRLGAFPDLSRPRVLWLGVESDGGALDALARRVRDALGEAGFWFDPKPFRAHVTLARLTPPGRPERAVGGRAGGWEALWKDMDSGISDPWPVAEVALVRSRLGRGGPEYTDEGRARLGKE